MNILYLGYWGANEGLSQSTINPHLIILANKREICKIIYITIERSRPIKFDIPSHEKIDHHPYYASQLGRFLTKLKDFISIPFFVARCLKKYNIDLTFCRSALAGGLGYLATRLSSTPYLVESFEPHSEYMRELGVWKKNTISYRLQKFLERKQKKTALHLLTVSNNYKSKLIKENLPIEKIHCMPCAANSKQFQYQPTHRQQIRKKLNLEDEAIVGIYVGKFGDIYWDEEAFELFKKAFSHFSNFFLIILTPHDRSFIKTRLEQFEIKASHVFYQEVEHCEVPKYLSASDFAFSTVRPSENRKYCCPIKNGEYWANGLPILSTPDIGDDSEIIQNENGGIVLIEQTEINWQKLHPLIDAHKIGNGTQELASKYRNFSNVRTIYADIVDNFNLINTK